jgi:hypothetical protein
MSRPDCDRGGPGGGGIRRPVGLTGGFGGRGVSARVPGAAAGAAAVADWAAAGRAGAAVGEGDATAGACAAGTCAAGACAAGATGAGAAGDTGARCGGAAGEAAGRGAGVGAAGLGGTVISDAGRLVTSRGPPGRAAAGRPVAAGAEAAAPWSVATGDRGSCVTGLSAGAFASGSGGATSRRSPSASAFRRTRSACASSIEDEWLLTPIPRAIQRSNASLFVSPSSRASS